MASTLSQKSRRTRTAIQRTRKVANMTPDELRAMIETLIDHKLTTINPTPAPSPEQAVTAQMRQRAISAAGRFRSGHPDISANHDDYLTTSYLG